MRPKVPTNQSFFIAGDCKDPAYRNVRDNPRYKPDWAIETGYDFVESLWTRYRALNLADAHFRREAMNHFLARFWEMYLAVTLHERGFQLMRVGGEGPEFYFLYNGCKVWVEAVAPGPGEGKDRVPELRHDEVNEIDPEKIILRFTNALAEKRNKYHQALQKNIIAQDDRYLLAINSRGIPSGAYGNPMPLFIQAFLPFGNLTGLIDTKTMKPVEIFYQKRENVIKANESPVPTIAFLNPEFSFVSAVLHSAVYCVDHSAIIGYDFSILHNPTAAHPLDSTVFQWCEQMFYHDGKLERRSKQKLQK